MAVFSKNYSSQELEQKLEKVAERENELQQQMETLRPQIAEKEAIATVDGGSRADLDKLRRQYADLRDELERIPETRRIIGGELASVRGQEAEQDAEKRKKAVEKEINGAEKSLKALQGALDTFLDAVTSYRGTVLDMSSQAKFARTTFDFRSSGIYGEVALGKLGEELGRLQKPETKEKDAEAVEAVKSKVYQYLETIPGNLRRNLESNLAAELQKQRQRAKEAV